MPIYATPEDAQDDLSKLLLKTVPENKHGRKTITRLAELYPLKRYSIQKWIAQQRVPASRVDRLVEIGRIGVPEGEPGRVSRKDFEPFVYNY